MSSVGGVGTSPASQANCSACCRCSTDPIRYRIALMGRGRVGKTALLRRFLYDEFVEKYNETVEDLHTKMFNLNGCLLVQADFLDTAGNMSFPAMRRLNIGTAHAFVLVYRLEPDMASFEEVKRIFDEIIALRGTEETMRTPIVIVENQIDLEEDGVALSPLFEQCWSTINNWDKDAVFRNGPATNGMRGARLDSVCSVRSTADSRSASTSASSGIGSDAPNGFGSRRNSASRDVEEFVLSKSFDYKLSFVRTSAKYNVNVVQIFEQLAKLSGHLSPPHSPNSAGGDSCHNDVGGLEDNFCDLHMSNGGSRKNSTAAGKKQPPSPFSAKYAAATSRAKRRFSLQTHSTMSHIPSAVLNEAASRLTSSETNGVNDGPTTSSCQRRATGCCEHNGSATLPQPARTAPGRQMQRRRESDRDGRPERSVDAAQHRENRKGSLPIAAAARKASAVGAKLFGQRRGSRSKSGDSLNAQECFVQ